MTRKRKGKCDPLEADRPGLLEKEEVLVRGELAYLPGRAAARDSFIQRALP